MPSRASLLEVIELFERSRTPLPGIDGARLRGVPGWELQHQQHLTGAEIDAWCDHVGDAACYPVATDGEPVIVELEPDDDPGRYRYRYRCPATFRRKFLPAGLAAVRAVRASRLLGSIADLLDIPGVLRTGIDAPLLDETLWAIGRARIGTYDVDVWIARNVHENLDEIFWHFNQPAQVEQGLVLTCGPELPAAIRPPRRYRFIPLRAVIVPHGDVARIDSDQLRRMMSGLAATIEPSLPVEYDEYAGVLKINGKDDWLIKGDRQRAAVKYMFQKYQAGRTELPASEILAAIYRGQPGGRSQRMQNLFAGTAWEDYIHTVKRGRYAFKLD